MAAQTGLTTAQTPSAHQPDRPTRFRWVICGLLFYATTVNYVDRSILGVLAPTLQQKIHWTDEEFGAINAAFNAAYALGFIFMGRLIDAVGTRLGYAIALSFWTLASATHALRERRFSSVFADFCSGSASPVTFPRPSKPPRNGSRSASARRRRAYSTPGPTSGRSWRRWRCRSWCFAGDGPPLFLSHPAWRRSGLSAG